MKAYRWLVYDTSFEQYKYLYIGDIDIYICKEAIPLHEQHIQHMESQKLVYSNIVRAYGAEPKWIQEYQKILEKIRVYTLIVRIYHKFFYHKRLSGLHFIKVNEYYKAIKQKREQFFKVYYDTHIASKIYCLKMKLYSNEALLYHIIKKSHLRLPMQVIDNIDVLMCNNMESNNFRPHHGLHFGMWRNRKKADESFDKYIQTRQYQDMYMQFKEDLAYDAVLKEIVENSPAKVKRIMNAMVDDLDNR